MLLLALPQRLLDRLDDRLGGHLALQELGAGRPLHHLGPREAGHLAEAIRAEDDVARFRLRIGH